MHRSFETLKREYANSPFFFKNHFWEHFINQIAVLFNKFSKQIHKLNFSVSNCLAKINLKMQ